MAMKKDRAELILGWLKDLDALASKNTDDIGWVALKISSSRAKAEREIDQAKRVLGAKWTR